MAELSDEELCRKIAERDAEAFELMVDRHQGRAYRLAWSILGNEADARDVSQDAFIRLYESAGRFDGRSRFSTWFYRILVNLCIDHRRRNRWWRRMSPLAIPGGDDPDEHAFDPPSGEAGPEGEAMLKQSISQLRPALAKLSAAAACRGVAADAGGIHQPRNRRGTEVLGKHGARARASRNRATAEVVTGKVSSQID